METLKERYLHLIKEKDVTPYQISEETGISNTVLSKIKLEKVKKISNTTAKLLANYFGVNKEWLLTGKGEALNQTNNQSSSINNNNNSTFGTLSGANVVGNINLNDIKEVLEISKGYQDLLRIRDTQIDKLLSLVENLTKNK
jgi:transcriptional regulator with XRE-family HTH domain